MSAEKEKRRILVGRYLVLEEYFDQAGAFLGIEENLPAQ
jgi:hypothetical protein